jgi:hypothetical protein
VNSILAYCVDDDDVDDTDKDILPIILFCATHSDNDSQNLAFATSHFVIELLPFDYLSNQKAVSQ